MARALRAVGGGALAALLSFAAVTWSALESGGVAVIETRADDGSRRSTHVWHVRSGGELWLEAGTPENPWYVDVQTDPLVVLRVNGAAARYRVEPLRDPAAHDRIRELIRQKYGFRDRWVGLLVDTSGSVAVRLAPVREPGSP